MDERNLNIEKKDEYFAKLRLKIFRQLLKFIRKFMKKRRGEVCMLDGFRMCIRQLIQRKLN